LESKFQQLNSELDEYQHTIEFEQATNGRAKRIEVIKPKSDFYTIMAYRLSGGDLTKMRKIFKMNEEDIYEALYLMRCDQINDAYDKL